MQKLIKYFRNNIYLILVFLISVPSFSKMIGFGMYSTSDFHIFRQVQFHKCVQALQLPCRWAPDAGLGYGEPIFNFYGQMPYVFGEIFYLLGFGYINSVKILFALSLIGSSVAMYVLAKKLWSDHKIAVLCATLYLYAPYRAVDVWVRGALPESLAFLFYPLLIYSIERKSLGWLSILISLLILTHNLSFVMFFPVLIFWIIYRKFWRGLSAFLVAGFLTAFYTLPVFVESRYVDIASTTQGYFDFHNHFVTLKQLFLSNFWGYGASNWGPVDEMSLAIGYAQWTLPILAAFLLFYKRRLFISKKFIALFVLGWFFVFLTHNKSTAIWETIGFMKYIQFPWRFLGIVVFLFSLSVGVFTNTLKGMKVFIFIFTALTVFINIGFFKPDIWYRVGDEYYLSGYEWDRQRSASIKDFWPLFGHEIPTKPSDGKYINYFPGWISKDPPDNGLILKEGSKFVDTPIRRFGNYISLMTVAVLCVYSIIKKWTRN